VTHASLDPAWQHLAGTWWTDLVALTITDGAIGTHLPLIDLGNGLPKVDDLIAYAHRARKTGLLAPTASG
jgi:hypothetical protein